MLVHVKKPALVMPPGVLPASMGSIPFDDVRRNPVLPRKRDKVRAISFRPVRGRGRARFGGGKSNGGGSSGPATTFTAVQGFTNDGSDSYLHLASDDTSDLQIEAEWFVGILAKLISHPPGGTERLVGKNDGSPEYSIAHATTPRLQGTDSGTGVLLRATTAGDVGRLFLMSYCRKTGTSGVRDTDGSHFEMWDNAGSALSLIQSDTTVSAPSTGTARVFTIGNQSPGSAGGNGQAAASWAIVGAVVGNAFLTQAQVEAWMLATATALEVTALPSGELGRWNAASGEMLTDLSGNGRNLAKAENTPGDLTTITEAPVWATP